MYDLLLNKVSTRKSTMKHSENSLGLSTSSTDDAECSQGKARELSRTCNNNSDMVTCLNTEHENQQTTSNPFDYRKEERESSIFNMPQRAKHYKAGLRRSGMFKSRQPSNERELADPMRHQVAIVKSYKLLKEELQRPDVIRISNKLFPEDRELQLEIESANKRRRVVDILLKRILACSNEKKSQFIGELRTVQCSKLLVDTKEVTEEDLTSIFFLEYIDIFTTRSSVVQDCIFSHMLICVGQKLYNLYKLYKHFNQGCYIFDS
ncbi:uncharacterized protein LOC132725121 [Ruditapes philippinarum]|uniref:uncharacterized protein LOC132725121 n=1 Tax=Ruditapes philippinarum TaxID=129788 RepID=UPI00295BA2EB|nr:uncharacterized protein LOC132725121 [Ruditapes philippinarum]XP_060566183.1 uncharacterized protein LOC132725121 [Ruditapes philippinarum]